MITARKYRDGKVETIVDPDDIDKSVDEGCLVWVDVQAITNDEANRLIEEFKIEDLAVEDIRDGGRRDGTRSARRSRTTASMRSLLPIPATCRR